MVEGPDVREKPVRGEGEARHVLREHDSSRLGDRLESRDVEQIPTSGALTQLRIGLRGFAPTASAARISGRHARLYELMITRVSGRQCART